MNTSSMDSYCGRAISIAGILFLLLAVQSAYTQPLLNITKVKQDGLGVNVQFTVECNSQPVYGLTKDNILLTDNGNAREINLWTLDPNVNLAVSVALVFDASQSMQGANIAGAKIAAHAFIDQMDGIEDEALLLTVNNEVVGGWSMTQSKQYLHTVADNMTADGLAPVWDGVYEGLSELLFIGMNKAQAVILLTDGVDRIRIYTPEDVVDRALEGRVAVYIVGIDAAASSAELRSIAAATGGGFYAATSPDSLARIYPEILARLRKGPDESELGYMLPCVDGRLHTLDLRVQDVCGGSDVKSVSYQSRFARVTFSDLFMALGDATIPGGKDFSVPLQLISWERPETFSDFSFRLKYDGALMQLVDIVAPPGSLMEGVAVTSDPEIDGARVTVNGSRIVQGSGLMLQCRFRAANPAVEETRRIEIEDFVFADGCLWPVVESGEIVIRPHAPEPVVSCDLDAPRTLRWDSGAGDYTPNPISVVFRAYNTGDAAALNARARISYDTAVFVLASPQVVEQPCSPPDIEPNSFSSVLWQLYAKQRDIPDSSRIDVEMLCDNHVRRFCALKVHVPARNAALSCALYVPNIFLDTLAGILDPMPFDVTVTGWNDSTTPVDSVWATIQLPPEIVFAHPDTQDSTSKLLSAYLLVPGKSGSASWKLRHEPSVTDRSYFVTVRLHGSSVETGCSAQVRIPRQPTAFYTYDVTAEGLTEFCEGGSVVLDAGAGHASYLWNTRAVSRKITVEESGEYFCRIVDFLGNTGLSRIVKVTEHRLPKADIRMRGPHPLCEGDTTWLRVDEPDGTRYLWSTGETRKEIPVWIPGMYHVFVQGTGGCNGRDTVMVAYHPRPLKPVISRIGDVLSVPQSDNAVGWFRNGSMLLTSFTNTLKLPGPGAYFARHYAPQTNCRTDSDTLVVTVLVTEAQPVATLFTLHAYPDPADDMLSLELRDAVGEHVRIVLTDVLGRSETVYSGRPGDAGVTFSLSLQGRARGPLFIHAWIGERVVVRKIMRN